MYADLLRSYPLFAALNPHELNYVVNAGFDVRFKTGELILQQGMRGAWLFIVLDGKVRTSRRLPSGREATLGTIGQNQMFGEYALLSPHRNKATCRASMPVAAFCIPLLDVWRVLGDVPAFRKTLKRWLQLNTLVSYLRGHAFLGFMSAPSALAHLDVLNAASYRKGLTIQATGLASNQWHYIEQGSVAIFDENYPEGPPQRVLKAGSTFGESGLLGRDNSHIAIALSDTRCQCLTQHAFLGNGVSTTNASRQSLEAFQTAWHQFQWVGQTAQKDCGVAALAMVAKFHGLNATSLPRFAEKRPDVGLTFSDLVCMAQSIGLWAQCVRIGLESVSQLTFPAIGHFRDRHFVVIFGHTENGFVIGDPAAGITELSTEAFAKEWSGHMLIAGKNG